LQRENITVDESKRRSGRSPWWKIGLVILVVAVAGVGGVLTGNRLADKRAVVDEGRRLDEDIGLGERTGLTGALDLQVAPTSLNVASGQPAKVNLTLTNKTDRPLTLNGWLNPAPADFISNQIPFKMMVTRAGSKVAFRGNPVLYPPHEKKDFFQLRPGARKVIPVDLSELHGIGRWDMSAPGEYAVELWYETYLTGRYVGISAWTGMTNHVIVRVTVRPGEAGSH
jgi:hypothetical protein